MIKRAQVRCENMDKEGEPSSSGIDINIDEETESDETPHVKRMLRSLSSPATSVTTKSRNPHVLPCVCIICKSEKSYFTESVILLIFLFFTIIVVIMIYIDCIAFASINLMPLATAVYIFTFVLCCVITMHGFLLFRSQKSETWTNWYLQKQWMVVN